MTLLQQKRLRRFVKRGRGEKDVFFIHIGGKTKRGGGGGTYLWSERGSTEGNLRSEKKKRGQGKNQII